MAARRGHRLSELAGGVAGALTRAAVVGSSPRGADPACDDRRVDGPSTGPAGGGGVAVRPCVAWDGAVGRGSDGVEAVDRAGRMFGMVGASYFI